MNIEELTNWQQTLKLGIACMSGELSEVKKLVDGGAEFKTPSNHLHARYEYLLAVSRDILPGEVDDNLLAREDLFPAIAIGALPLNSTEERLKIIDYLMTSNVKTDFSGVLFFSILWNNEPVANYLINKGIVLSENATAIINTEPESYLCDIYNSSIIDGSDDEIVWRLTTFSKCLSGKKTVKAREVWLKKFCKNKPVFSCIFNVCKIHYKAYLDFFSEFVKSNSVNELQFFAECGCFKVDDNLDKLIKIATDGNYQECSLFLMGYKNSHTTVEKEAQRQEKALLKELRGPSITEQLKKDWSFKKRDDGTLSIYEYKGEDKETIEIPSYIGKTKVSTIKRESKKVKYWLEPIELFDQKKYKKIKHVHLLEGIETIGEEAFNNMICIESITIPNSVKTICKRAFSNCSGLTSITIPNSVTEIEWDAFVNCTGLTSVTIPNNVTKIGNQAFSGCSGLTSIIISDGVTEISNSAFSGCSSLTSITVDPQNKVYYSIDNCIITKNSNELIVGCNSSTIPNIITKIGECAFSGRSSLKSITIPESVTEIGKYAFSGCSDLTSITISNSVTEIGYGAFSSCSGLTSITIPNSVTKIGSSAFYNCSNLINITIPNSVTEIGTSAFEACSCLSCISIPNGVTEIGKNAFMKCRGLESATIPTSVTKIGTSAFEGCQKLANITIPSSVTEVGEYAFNGCQNLTSISFSSATKMGRGSLNNCGKLQKIFYAGKASYDFKNNFLSKNIVVIEV